MPRLQNLRKNIFLVLCGRMSEKNNSEVTKEALLAENFLIVGSCRVFGSSYYSPSTDKIILPHYGIITMNGGFPIITPHEIIAPHYGIITMIGEL